jgi:hypothetical protein
VRFEKCFNDETHGLTDTDCSSAPFPFTIGYTITAFDPQNRINTNEDVTFDFSITTPCSTDSVDFSNVNPDDNLIETFTLEYNVVTSKTFDF